MYILKNLPQSPLDNLFILHEAVVERSQEEKEFRDLFDETKILRSDMSSTKSRTKECARECSQLNCFVQKGNQRRKYDEVMLQNII